MVPTEKDYNEYANKLQKLTHEQAREIEHHKGYHGRKKYYPFKLDEWKRIGEEMPKKHKAAIKELDVIFSKMRIEIDEYQKKLMDAATKGPQCAICLEYKYTNEGPNVAVSFNNKHCKHHIFHEQCVSDGRVKKCPLCRSDNKKLTKVDNKKLTKIYKNSKTPSPKTRKIRSRCPKGTRRDPITKECKSTATSNTTSKINTTSKRCPNGTRKNKKTGKCDGK